MASPYSKVSPEILVTEDEILIGILTSGSVLAFLSQLVKHVAANNVINGKIVFRIMLLALFLQIYENKRTKGSSFWAIWSNSGFLCVFSIYVPFLISRVHPALRICPVIAYKKKMCIFVLFVPCYENTAVMYNYY